MILSPKQDCLLAWELLLVCGASMFLVAVAGGLEDFLRNLEMAQRELQLPRLDIQRPQRERRNVVKRPGVSYEHADDNAVGLRGPGAGSDDANQESLQGFEEQSLSDNEVSDEAAILRELEEINAGSDAVKSGPKGSSRSKRQRHRTARAYGSTRDDVQRVLASRPVDSGDQAEALYRDLGRLMDYARGRQSFADDQRYPEVETSKQFKTPNKEQYGVDRMSRQDLVSPEIRQSVSRRREFYGNSTADDSSSRRLLDDMHQTRKNDLLGDTGIYMSSGMGGFASNIRRSRLDSETDTPNSRKGTFNHNNKRTSDYTEFFKHSGIDKSIAPPYTSRGTRYEDERLSRYLERGPESATDENELNGGPDQREHEMVIPYRRNSLVPLHHLGEEQKGTGALYRAPFSEKEAEFARDKSKVKSYFHGTDTDRNKFSERQLVRWKNPNNDANSYSSGADRRVIYGDQHSEGIGFGHNHERQTLMEHLSESKHEHEMIGGKHTKYMKRNNFRYSDVPVANYELRKRKKAVAKKKAPLTRDKYYVAKQPRSGRTKGLSSDKQKHSASHVARYVSRGVAAAASKGQLILDDSPGNFDLFDTGHSSKQRSFAKLPKDEERTHFLWDNQFQNTQHNESENRTKHDSAEMHVEKDQNASTSIQKLDIEEHASDVPREDPDMADVHSGKTVLEILDEVMGQVQKSKEVSKHVAPFLKRDKATEAEVHNPPEEEKCGGHPCPNSLLTKLTNSVAEIVNKEVHVARCELMPDTLHSFVAWLLEGAREEFRPENPGFVDGEHLAFYAAYYREGAPTPPPPAVTEHSPAQEASTEFPPTNTSGAVKEGGTAAGKEPGDERARQIRLLEMLLKEYDALSAREQTRLLSVHEYLQQQLSALHGVTTACTSATLLPAHTAEVGEEGEVVSEVPTTPQPSGEEHLETEKPLEAEQEDNLPPHEEEVVDQDPTPGKSEEEYGGGMETPQSETRLTGNESSDLTQDVEKLIQKDLELLGLGNSSNFGTRFHLGLLSNYSHEENAHGEEEAPEEAPVEAPADSPEGAPEGAAEGIPEASPEEPPEGAQEGAPEGAPEGTPEEAPEGIPDLAPEVAPETRARKQKRVATMDGKQVRRHAQAETTSSRQKVVRGSLQPMTERHLLTDAEGRAVLQPLLDNSDALQLRRR